MKKVILFSLFSLLIFASCEKEDPRDVYVGNWSISQNGNIQLYQGSSVSATIPVTQSGSVFIYTSGTDELEIDGLYCQLSGTKLIFDSKTETETSGTVVIQLTTIRSGTASPSIISIKETYSGTWANGSQTGIISGSSNITLTKK
jgi:hypothetical protein